ncbi:hypothetical protein T484DRAFT_1838998 [Baffinella frigidus]|nr:hypothetical protein T484DRAFT_1838998 [Cryptophyta sp. CCMP2293]
MPAGGPGFPGFGAAGGAGFPAGGQVPDAQALNRLMMGNVPDAQALNRMMRGIFEGSVEGQADLEEGRHRLQQMAARARFLEQYLAAVPAETERFIAEADTDRGRDAGHEMHGTVTCDACNTTPLRGPRWTCATCPAIYP